MRTRQKCRAVKVMTNNIWLMYNKESLADNGKVMSQKVRHKFIIYTEYGEKLMYEPAEIVDLVDKHWHAIGKYWYKKSRPFAKTVRKTFRVIGCGYLKKHGEKYKKWW